MAARNLLRALVLLILALLSALSASAEIKTFTLQIMKEDGTPWDAIDLLGETGLAFFKADGGYFYYQPQLTKTGPGVYTVKYDDLIMRDPQYTISIWCYDPMGDYSSWTTIYKKVPFPPSSAVTMNCNGDTGIPRFTLSVKNSDGSDYNGCFSGIWKSESSGFKSNIDSGYSCGSKEVTLNEGKHLLYFDYASVGSPREIIVGPGGAPPLILDPPSASLTAHVDKDSLPLENSLIRLDYYSQNQFYNSGYTDQNGDFTKSVVPGDYFVTACCNPQPYSYYFCYGQQIVSSVSLAASDSKTVNIDCNLVINVDVSLKLVDQPLAGMWVTAYQYIGSEKKFVKGGYTDSDGMVRLNLTPGEYIIESTYKTTKKSSTITIPPAPAQPVEIIFDEPTNEITVTVKNKETGQPINGSLVRIFRPPLGAAGTGYTDESGVFSTIVYPGFYNIRVTCFYPDSDQLFQLSSDVDLNSPQNLDFLCARGKINVNVVDEYAPNQFRDFQGSVYVRLYDPNTLNSYNKWGNPTSYTVLPDTGYYLFADVLFEDPDGTYRNWYLNNYDTGAISVGPGDTIYITIPFKSYELSAGNDPFGDLTITFPTEIVASDFELSPVMLIIAALSLSLMLALLQAKNIKPKSKQ